MSTVLITMQVTPALVRPALGAREVWRDFGLNPVAMLDRATLSPPPPPGSELQDAVPADPGTLEGLRTDLKQLLGDLKGGFSEVKLRLFQARFARVAAGYGVEIAYHRGAPRTNWGGFPRLEIYDQGGPAALHEMTHALQCCVGAVAGLSTETIDAMTATLGRKPTPSEVRQNMPNLSDKQRQSAFETIVQPMETQAYARFEEGAFYATGMLGKKARDLDFYAPRASQNVDAFIKAYEQGRVPILESGLDARVYGRIGHIARTHTETAVLLGLAGYGYHRLVNYAMGVHPLAGACALIPLGCLIYRVAQG